MLRVKQQSLKQPRNPAPEPSTPTEAPANTNTEAAGATTAGSADTSTAAPTNAAPSNGGAATSGKTATSSSDANTKKMTDLRNKILQTPFRFGSTSAAEIIDIVNDYPWIVDEIVGNPETYNFNVYTTGSDTVQNLGEGYAKKTNIPICYVMERKSAVNAGVANIFNLISQVNDVSGNLISGVKSMGSVGQEAGDMMSAAAGSFKSKITELIGENFTKFAELLKHNNLNDEVLNPYRYLYITASTGKRFTFPLVNKNATSYMPSKNAWDKPKNGLLKPVQAIFDSVGKVLEGATNLANMAKNITGLNSGNSEDNSTVNEAAKAFKYPTAGDNFQIQFTLYNTTRKDAWRDNFRFIYLFALRNLPMRTETLSFLPPCLYDIIIPGVKRLPVCGLTSFKVEPRGMIRTLQCPNFIDVENIGDANTNRPIPVSVPEAWDLTLDFQSLIAPSANLMLSTIVGKLGIDAALDFERLVERTAEENAARAKEVSANEKELTEACEKINRTLEWRKNKEVQEQALRAGYAEAFKRNLDAVLSPYHYDGATGMPKTPYAETAIRELAASLGIPGASDAGYKVLGEQIADKLVEMGAAQYAWGGKENAKNNNCVGLSLLHGGAPENNYQAIEWQGSKNGKIDIDPNKLDINAVSGDNWDKHVSNYINGQDSVNNNPALSADQRKQCANFQPDAIKAGEAPDGADMTDEEIAAARQKIKEYNDAVTANGGKAICDDTQSNK